MDHRKREHRNKIPDIKTVRQMGKVLGLLGIQACTVRPVFYQDIIRHGIGLKMAKDFAERYFSYDDPPGWLRYESQR